MGKEVKLPKNMSVLKSALFHLLSLLEDAETSNPDWHETTAENMRSLRRLMADALGEKPPKVIVTKRSDDFHACFEGNSGSWECGKSHWEAIGRLLFNHQGVSGVAIAWNMDDAQTKKYLKK